MEIAPGVGHIGVSNAGPRTFRRTAVALQVHADYLFAAAAVTIITFLFLLNHRALRHWFLFPVMACGILAGVDIVRWLRAQLELFDPRTIIACLAFYGFFVAPILHVIWNQFGVNNDLQIWDDWRPWLGAMAALNALGLAVYRLAQKEVFIRTKPSQTSWSIDRSKFHPLAAITLACSASGAIAFLSAFGGIPGMIRDFEVNQEAFVGKGWLLVFAWPLAVLSFIVLAYIWSDKERRIKHPLTIGLLLVCAFGAGHFILMGWYGSRSATVWALFWMAGIVHFRFHNFSRKMMAAGLIFLLSFMYFYGFYKERGRTGFQVLDTPAMWLNPTGYERNIEYVLLGDLARADVTACILHNIIKQPDEYEFRWGLTYVSALGILIPRNIWPSRPSVKVEAGTEALWGKGAPWPSSRMYGLNGEAMLNFGPAGIVPLFAIYGAVVGWFRRKSFSWDRRDARMFLAPFCVSMLVAALVYDSDVIAFFAVTEGALACALILASSKRKRIRHLRESACDS